MPVISMLKKVISAKANYDFTLDLKFSDGKEKRFDAKPYLDFPVFRELKDLNRFKNIKIVFGAVQWQNEQDITPETLYVEGEDLSERVFYESSKGNEIEQLGR